MIVLGIGAVITLAAGIVVMWMPYIYKPISIKWYQRIGMAKQEKYRALNVREPPEKGIERVFRKCMIISFLILLIGLCIAIYFEQKETGGDIVTQIERPEFGNGAKKVELYALLEGQQKGERLELEMKEQIPDEKQLNEFFDEIFERVMDKILAANKSFQEVQSDLNFITKLDGGIVIEWETSEPSVINQWGELQEDIPMEGTDVTVWMKIVYGNYRKEYTIPVTVWGKEPLLKECLESYVSEQIASDSEDVYIELPKEYNSQEIVFQTAKENTAWKIMILTFLAVPVIWVYGNSRVENEYKKRNSKLLLDYPEIVSKLSILIHAGLTVPVAWERITADYEQALRKGAPKRFGYEEMWITAHQISNTGYTGQAFIEFGRRCGCYCYMKLGNLLEQNMKTGVADLCAFMEEEVIQAFEVRKSNARKAGEEAGTKLLLPMMMMFVLVLVIVIVPAWSSMNF